jgi:hypothetical protein
MILSLIYIMDSLFTKNRDNRPYVMAFGIMVIFISIFIVIYYVSTHRVGTGGIVSGIILGFIVLIMVIIAIFHFLNYGNNPSSNIHTEYSAPLFHYNRNILDDPRDSPPMFNESSNINRESNETSNTFIPLSHTEANIQLNPHVSDEPNDIYIDPVSNVQEEMDYPPSEQYNVTTRIFPTNRRPVPSPDLILERNVQEETKFPVENIEPLPNVQEDIDPLQYTINTDPYYVRINQNTTPSSYNTNLWKEPTPSPFVDHDDDDVEDEPNSCVIS